MILILTDKELIIKCFLYLSSKKDRLWKKDAYLWDWIPAL